MNTPPKLVPLAHAEKIMDFLVGLDARLVSLDFSRRQLRNFVYAEFDWAVDEGWTNRLLACLRDYGFMHLVRPPERPYHFRWERRQSANA